ncbi:hypothetical protein PHYSODRAFT_343302 [Phytophthora sojae]|uniref:Uncharacterized protein n=1 Tax=Phytophthora sojae (strain P6497) TaxID=1094619 RepID=G5AJA4_PHYSP|nr:hypothetical protein PHYSODRAFT_343302 [Phytophthora sojae]EGZ04397.1 hypothetical protein PHYSODRAFT_343302 [Phytophthora sojae]|eukprot:XP_009540155.1 hypothetical protein PHYSODRAFT_343302 [Phytophthora sojae]
MTRRGELSTPAIFLAKIDEVLVLWDEGSQLLVKDGSLERLMRLRTPVKCARSRQEGVIVALPAELDSLTSKCVAVIVSRAVGAAAEKLRVRGAAVLVAPYLGRRLLLQDKTRQEGIDVARKGAAGCPCLLLCREHSTPATNPLRAESVWLCARLCDPRLAGSAGGFVCDSSVAVDAEADKLSALRRSDVTSRRWMGCRLYKNTPSCWVAAPGDVGIGASQSATAFQSGDGDSVQVWLKIARSTGLRLSKVDALAVETSAAREAPVGLKLDAALAASAADFSSTNAPERLLWKHRREGADGGKLRAAVFAHASQTIFLLQKFCRVDHAAVTAPELDPCATPIGASIDRKPQVREILDLLEKRLLKAWYGSTQLLVMA